MNCIWVSNHGSIGFDVDFDVSNHPDSTKPFHSFRLVKEGNPFHIDQKSAPSPTLTSLASNQGWLDIPGYDGSGIPIPYPGYLHSFDYKIDGERDRFIPFASPPGFIGPVVFARVRVSLYVVLNSEGTLESMNAWVDDGGDGYEVPVYYSAGGPDGPFYTFP